MDKLARKYTETHNPEIPHNLQIGPRASEDGEAGKAVKGRVSVWSWTSDADHDIRRLKGKEKPMDNFATRGPVNVADALAALALVRALLKTLQAKRVIGTSDVNSIVADALGQIGPLSSTDAGREARRLIQKFNQPSNQPSTTAQPTEETTDLSNFNPPKSKS